MLHPKQVHSTLRRRLDMRLRIRSPGMKDTDLENGHHFVGIVVLSLLLSYLIWEKAQLGGYGYVRDGQT